MKKRKGINPNDIEAVKIVLLSPDRIEALAKMEVTRPACYDTKGVAVPGGLFCQRIFGNEISYRCACGKYRKAAKLKGNKCEKCNVKLEDAIVRRERFAYIQLAEPLVHIWFIPILATLLKIPPKIFSEIVRCKKYMILTPGKSPYKKYDTMEFTEYFAKKTEYRMEAETGGKLVELLLADLNLEKLYTELKNNPASRRVSKRLKLVRDLIRGGVSPQWMVLRKILVLPPALRPFLFMSNGTIASSDINELYVRIINRSWRLSHFNDQQAPLIVRVNDLRLLQLSVDALFQNGKSAVSKDRGGKRVLKSLTDMIQTKKGRMRRNLLGKRVDYSARSVIAPGPALKLHQCGLPKDLAMDMMRPFVYGRLMRMGLAPTLKHARKLVDWKRPEAIDALDAEITEKVVLLNRAPSLHRTSFQAFDPVLIEGRAIQLHPFVCSAFNADFDGDQMGVHLPLSVEAQVECRLLASSIYNIFSPATGKPITVPSQEIVLGIYYLTKEREACLGQGMIFSDREAAETAYQYEVVELHTKIKVRINSQLVDTTIGRVLFSLIFPPDFPFKDLNQTIKKKNIGQLIEQCYETYGHRETVVLLDRLKDTGFHYATLSGISLCIDDATIPKEKAQIIETAKKEVAEINKGYAMGVIQTDDKRHNTIVDIWKGAIEEITAKMMENFGIPDNPSLNALERKELREFNSIYMMADSGARGATEQIRQLAGMRGLMAKPNGDIVETPIISNLREGQSYMEFLLACHGARKGRADGALKTANAGYFTRKLVDSAHSIVIREQDCGTREGIDLSGLFNDDLLVIPLKERVLGRVAALDIKNPENGEIIVHKGDIVKKKDAGAIGAAGITTVKVRSPLTCKTPNGVCSTCYGMDLSNGRKVGVGEAVGIIAAQSIGEPGTQLTLRTFHHGGTAAGGAKKADIIAQEAGQIVYQGINYVQNEGGRRVVTNRSGRILVDQHGKTKDLGRVPYGAVLNVADGEMVEAEQKLARWEPFSVPIITPFAGEVEYRGIVDGVSAENKINSEGLPQRTIMQSGGTVIPEVVVAGHSFHLPIGAILVAKEGATLEAGDTIADIPMEAAKNQDITNGLPRVLQLLEVRKIPDAAVLSEISGEVFVQPARGKYAIVVVKAESGDEKKYKVKIERILNVHNGDVITAGDAIQDGVTDPRDILHIFGPVKAALFIVDEVQKVYQQQGVATADKHFEIITRQMIEKVRITSSGDTDLITGELMTKANFLEVNNKTVGKKATATHVLLGLAQVGKQSESWISAASFESTVKALSEAALKAKVDNLEGTKENIVLGKVVPLGTGFDSLPH